MVQIGKTESNRMDRMNRIKREGTAASLLLLYPDNPVHPVNCFLSLKLNLYPKQISDDGFSEV
jgi:hypothetical protein